MQPISIYNASTAVILSAHQPACLPWLGYFHKIALSDKFVILDNVQFEKNSFINRNKIKTAQGVIWLTVPMLISGHIQKTISGIEINNRIDWRKKHWKSIYFNYKKAPYFHRYVDFFEGFYKKEWTKLYNLIEYMLFFFIKELGIKTVFYKQTNLQLQSKKQELILDLCKQLKANVFIFGALGKNYADVDAFRRNGINVYFQDYRHPIYPQLWGDFISHLSIIDLLFNVGKERALEIIMEGNVTKSELKRIFKI